MTQETIRKAKEHLEGAGYNDLEVSYCVADNIISELLEVVEAQGWQPISTMPDTWEYKLVGGWYSITSISIKDDKEYTETKWGVRMILDRSEVNEFSCNTHWQPIIKPTKQEK